MDQPSSEPEDGEIKTEDEDDGEDEGEYLPISNRRGRKGGRGRGRPRYHRRENFEDNSRQPGSQLFTRSRHLASSSKPFSRGRRRPFANNFNQRRLEQPPEFPANFGRPPFQKRASGPLEGRRNSGAPYKGRRRESTSVSSISSEDEQGTSSKAVSKISQDCNGAGGTHAKPSTLKAEASTSKPQPKVDKSKIQSMQGMEQVSDDDDQESVIFVPTVRKSPVIITLDVTDTSEDEEKEENVDLHVQNEDKTDSSTSQQQTSSNISHQDSHTAIPTASNSGIEQRILKPRPIPGDSTGNARAATFSSTFVEIRKRDLTGTVRPITAAANGASSNHCSSVTEISINNVVEQPSVSNLHADNRDGDEPYSPSATIDSSECTADSATSPNRNRVEEEDDDDIAVLELRNELLADLMSKIPSDGDGATTPESAKLPKVQKDDDTKKLEKAKNKSSTKAPPTNEGIDSDEEKALRDVLLSQMKIKKAKRQDTVVPNGDIVPSTSTRRRQEKSSRTEHKKSKHISPIKVHKTPSTSTVTAPRSIVSRSKSRTSLDSLERDNGGSKSTGSSSRCKISQPPRPSSTDKLTARRRRFNDHQSSSEDIVAHTDKRKRHEHFSSCMDPVNPSLHQPEVHRVVRVVDEPLLPELPKRVIKKKSLKNLPATDLRRKLIKNAKHKNVSPQISPGGCGREFGLVDTDMRSFSTTPEDFTIQRTVNFTDDSRTTTVASGSRRTMEPVTIDIPPPSIQFREQRTPQGYQASPHSPPEQLQSQQQQSSPAVVVSMNEQLSPVHPLFGSLNIPLPATPEGSTFAQQSPQFGVLPKIGAQISPNIASLSQSHRLGIGTPYMQNHPQVSPASVHMHSPQIPIIHQQQVSPGQFYMQMQQHQQQQPQSPYNPTFITTPNVVSQHSFGIGQEYLPENNGMSQFSPHNMQNTSHVPGIPLPSPHYVESRNSMGPIMYPMSQTPIMSIPGYPTPQIGTGGPDVDYRILSPAPPNVFLNQPPNQNNPSCMYGGGSSVFAGNSLPMYHHQFQGQSTMVTTIPNDGNYQGLSVYAASPGAPMQTMHSHQYMNGGNVLPSNVPYTSALTIDTTEANRLGASSLHFRPILEPDRWDSPQSPDIIDTPINCIRTLAFEDPSQETLSVSIAGPPSALEVSASEMSGVRVSSKAHCNYSPNSHSSTSSSSNQLQTEDVKGTVLQKDINNRLMRLAGSSETVVEKLSSPALPKISPKSRKAASICPEIVTIDDDEPNRGSISRKPSPENLKSKAPLANVTVTKAPVATSTSSGAQSKLTIAKELPPKSPAVTPALARVMMQSVPSKSPTASPYGSDDEQRNLRDTTKSQMSPVGSLSSPPAKSGGTTTGKKSSPSTTTKLVSPTSSNDSGISEMSTTPTQQNSTSEVTRKLSKVASMTSLVSHSAAGSKKMTINSAAVNAKPVSFTIGAKKTPKTVETKSSAPTQPNTVTSKQTLPTVTITVQPPLVKPPLVKPPPPVKRMKRIIIPVRDDDTSTSEDEGLCAISDGGGMDTLFQAKLDEFLKNTRHLVEQRNNEQKRVESPKEAVKLAPKPQLPKQAPVPSTVSSVAAAGDTAKKVKSSVEISASAPTVSTPPPPPPTRPLNQSTVSNKPVNGITNQEPKLVQKTPSLAEKIREAIEKAGRITPAQARLAALETTKSKQIAASSNAKLLESKAGVQNLSTPISGSTIKPTPANIPRVTATTTNATPTSTPKISPVSSSNVVPSTTPKSTPASTLKTTPVSTSKVVSAAPTKITSAATPPKVTAASTLTPTPAPTQNSAPTKESQNSAIKPKAKLQISGRPIPKPSTPVTPSTSKGGTAVTTPSLDTMSPAMSAELINELMKKITESRDHLALSGAEKKLLSIRQKCVKDIREIKTNLEQHARFTNLSAATQNEISELEKKIDLLKSRKSVMDARANILNSNVIKLSKPLLVTRAQCVKLSQAVKKMGQNVIGGQYKVTDMFVNDINIALKSLERLHSLQEVHLQTQRGIEFHQVIGKKAWQPKSVIAKSSVSPVIATPPTPTPSTSASALRNSTTKLTPVVPKMESTTGKEVAEPVKKAAKTSLSHQSANQKPPVIAGTSGKRPSPPRSETIEAEVIGFLTRHATSSFPPDGQKPKLGQKRKRTNSLRINLKEPLSEPSGGVIEVDLRSHLESPLKFFRQKGDPAPVVDSNLQLCPEWLEGNCEQTECAFQHL